jgi:hypothetical protein
MGATEPTGQTEFQFNVPDVNCYSHRYDWLVVAGHKAMYKGVGTINGMANFGFMISAVDEKLTPSTDVDLFRIKIWDKDIEDTTVYDSQMGAEDDAHPGTAIGGGSIVIHKDKQSASVGHGARRGRATRSCLFLVSDPGPSSRWRCGMGSVDASIQCP